MTMRRRFLAAGALLPMLWWVNPARAQAKRTPVVIGWLITFRAREKRGLTAFKEALAELGWKEGLNYVVEERSGDGRYDRLPVLAQEIAARKPAVIVAAPSSAVAAAAKAAPTTPVVAAGGDPLWTGLVSNLARPGGMITGVSHVSSQLFEKRVELLLRVAPKVRRIGILVDPAGRVRKLAETVRSASESQSVQIHSAEAGSVEAIEQAITRLSNEGVEALVVGQSPFFVTERQRIVDLALAHRWPIISGMLGFTEAGALLSYGASQLALFQRAAHYVDRILKGARPGDLPIEQPATFELVVNINTAKRLGLTIPKVVLVRADRIIEH